MNKKLLILLVLFFTVAFTSAQNTRFSVNSGNWNNISTWSTTSGGAAGASVPLATDAVVIERGRTVSVNINNAVCASLQLGGLTADNSGTLTFSTTTITDPTLTVTGLVQVGGAGNANRDGIITFISGSTLTAGSLTLGNSAGTPGQGAVTMTSNSIMNVGALNVINAGHTWTPGIGTVNMTATNTLPATTFTSFNNLNINSGTTTMGVGLTINGNLNIASGANYASTSTFTLGVTGTTGVTGTLTLGGTGTKTFTGDVTINSGGTWDETGVAAINYAGNLQNDGTYTANTGTHTFSGATKTISGANTITIPNVAVTGTYTNNSNGVLTVSTALSGAGTLTNAVGKTLNIGGTSSIGTLANAGTTIINGSGAISTGIANFRNTGTLNLNGSGAITGITNNAGGTVNLASSGTIDSFNNATASSQLNISALILPTITTLTATTPGNTVNYNGAGNQIIKSNPYSNLTFSNSGTKTLSANMTTTGVLTLNDSASFAMSTFLLTLNGNLINNGTGTITGTTAGVTISGNAAQNIAGFTTTGPVTMSKTTGGLAIFTGNVNGGSLSISGGGGRLSLGVGLTHTFTGNWTRSSGELYGGTSTLRIAGNISGTGSTFSAETGTVEFYGGNQNLAAAALAYNNLTLSGTGSKTFGAVTTVNGIWSINSLVKANLGTFTRHGANTLFLHGSGPLSGSWGSLSSVATNRNNTYFDLTAGMINVVSVINNNFASYNNATGDVGGGVVGENTGPLVLTAPNGTVFINAKFASYGTPGGTYPNFVIGGCHAPTSLSVTTGLLGNTTATMPAGGASFNDAFGDPCSGTIKSYYVVATYALPICSGSSPGIITGSTPIGGNGTYTYLWEQSTSVNGTYTTVPGTSTAKDYTPGTLTATTYYRRTVTSGIYTDGTIVIVPIIVAPTTAPVITGLCSNSTLTVPASPIAGTYVEWFSGSCGSTVIATGTAFNPTATGTYFARYTNRCGSTSCGSFVVGSTPSNPVSITPTNPSPICNGTTTASLPYMAAGTPTTYSITWSPSAYLIDIAGRPLPASPISLDIPEATPSGTYTGTIFVRTAAGCLSATKTFTIQIGITTSAASSSPTFCQNTVMTNITHTTTGTTGIGTPTGLPIGVSASWASNTITISGTPTQSGTFNYSIPLTGSCSGTVNATGTIIVNPPSVGGTISGGATVCSGKNSTVLTLSGHTGAVVRWESSLDNFATAASTIANTSTTLTVTNLSATTFYRAVLQDGVCAAATSGTVTVMVETNTWKVILGVAQWEKGMPNINQSIVFEANYNQNVNLEGCSCEVKSGTITITEGKTMTLTNELKVSGGTLTFQNNASLVQINDVSNAGAITYERRTETAIDKFDYTYWSSPVSPQTLYNVSPNTLADKYMSFDAVTNNWKVENSITKVMEPGVGYSIRGPQNYYAPNPPNPFPASFIGVPHNGTIEVPITATDASYLLGNPYPSALDADAFLTNNAGVIDGTIYFWTHVTDIAPSGSQYIYNSDDYATYNLTGGVGTDNKEYPKGGVESISGSTKPTGKIASGQGFFATGIAAGNVEFKNAMRVGIGGITGENIQFFRTKNSKSKVTSSTIEKNRVWLNLTNTEGAFKQLLVGYVTGATNEYDTSYDGFSFSLNEYINFYSIVANEAMAIQGRALPFDENDLVPLGYSSAIVGDFSIGIDEVDGAMQSQNVFLEDKMLGVIHNLKEASYNFTTEKGVFNERFVLRYTDKTLGTGDFESEDKTIVVFKEKNELKIKSEFETMKRVTIFDLLGKKVFEETLKDVNEFRTSNITLKNQIVIVKVVLTNGQVVAKKVSY